MEAQHLLDQIRPMVDAGEVPGAVVGVLQKGLATAAAVGTRDPDGHTAMPVDAVMRISSNTKPMVAAMALLLVQDGVLHLDDPVETFLPELTDRRVLRRLAGPLDDVVPAHRPITVEDLLTMRMGFGFVFDSDCPAVEAAAAAGLGFGPPDPPALPAPSDWISRFAALPLLEQPGTVWRYELAYAVRGVVLARASTMPLDRLMREKLFTPLGMSQTGFVGAPEHLVPSFARNEDGLVVFDSAVESRWSTRPAFPDARGGLVSTAGDMLRFARMLLEGGCGFLSPELVATMTADQLTEEQRSAPSAHAFLDGGGWGYGVGITRSMRGRRYGWGGGLGTLWYTWPEHETAVVLMTQVMPPSHDLFETFTNAAEMSLAR